jgi:hypothetical protein
MAQRFLSQYWLEELPKLAKQLSVARKEREEFLISEETLRAFEGVYRHALQQYTNPFSVNKYMQ